MKHKGNAFWAWLLGSCISFGSTAAMVTAFSLDADLAGIGIFCAVFCAVCAVCFSIKGGSLLLILAGSLFTGFALREGTLLDQLQQLIQKISKLYSLAYDWKVLDFGQGLISSLTMALQLIGAVSGFGVTLSLCRRKAAAVGMLIGVLPMLLCFVVTDTVPAQWCVFLVLGPMLLWLLSQSVRRRDPRQGARLTALLLIPVLLFSWVLMHQLDPGKYKLHEQYLQQLFPLFAQTPDGGGVGGGNTKDYINLATVGPRTPSIQQIMEVTASVDGKLYLRGQAFDVYDGKSWSVTPGGERAALWPTDLEWKGKVTISLKTERDLQYTPYYPGARAWSSQLHNGRLPNTGNQTEYWFNIYEPTSATQSIQLTAEDAARYLSLPTQTLDAAWKILEENGLEHASPDTIIRFVQESARYSLSASRMDADESDFAIWFLTEADTGYCVHFATAAVVLLRAAGIPARYVEGYAFTAKWNVPTSITEAAAHAWVEYMDVNFGWEVLDPTPADIRTDPTEPTQTEPTQTESSEPSGETTEPSGESTEPSTDPTQPSDSQATQPIGDQTTPSTGPSGGHGGSDLTKLLPILQFLACAAGALALLWGQYRLRRLLRLRKRSVGDPNRRALACWRELCRNDRLLKKKPPEALRTLAERAKFSQHSITAQELRTLESYLRQQENQLRQQKWYRRLALQLLWAAP